MQDREADDERDTVGGTRDRAAFVRMLDEFTALVQQVRAEDLTSDERAALGRVLDALVKLTRLPKDPSAAK